LIKLPKYGDNIDEKREIRTIFDKNDIILIKNSKNNGKKLFFLQKILAKYKKVWYNHV